MRLIAEIREAGGTLELLPTGELASRKLTPEHKARVKAARTEVVAALQEESRREGPSFGEFQRKKMAELLVCLYRISSTGHEVEACMALSDLLITIQANIGKADWVKQLSDNKEEAHRLTNKILKSMGYLTGNKLAQQVKVILGSSEINDSAFD